MTSPQKPDFYSAIISAQQNDFQSNYGKAFVFYLDGINGLTTYLKNEAIDKLDAIGTENIDPKLVNGVNTLRNCIERLSMITNLSDNNNGCDCVDSNSDLVTKLSQHSIDELDSHETNETEDSEVDTNCLSPMSSTNLQKALKENAFLHKVFATRLRGTADPFKRASLKLELQRRIAENIELAKNKDKELYHSMHLQQRITLELAAKKLVQQQSVLNLDNESMIVDNQSQQQLYAQILDFESKNFDLSQQFRCLSLSPDKSVITQIIIRILKFKGHPLTQWIDKFQTQIIHIINPLLKQYLKRRPIDDKCSGSDGRTSSTSSSSSLQSLSSFDLIDEMDINICEVESEALIRHFTNITTDISLSHETITLMFSLIMFENQLYYKPSNYDLCREQHLLVHTIVSHYFYPPLWTAFKFLFRIVFYKHEKQLKEGINEFLKSNEMIDEFGDNYEENVFEETIASLKSVIELQSPYEKLKSMVRLTQSLCSKLKSNSEDSTEVSADDLIPALCLAVVKSGYHQLISECYAIEQLVDQKYLLGEEGYCLSSIMTALKYIQMHSSSSDAIQ